MNQEDSRIHRVARAIVQKLVRAEYEDWPPITPWGLYYPNRPRTIPPSAKLTRRAKKNDLFSH